MYHSSECSKVLHCQSLAGCLKVKWTNGKRTWYDNCCIGMQARNVQSADDPLIYPILFPFPKTIILMAIIASILDIVEMCRSRSLNK